MDRDSRLACLTLDLEPDYGRTGTCAAFAHSERLCSIIEQNRAKLTVFVVGKLLDEPHQAISDLAGINSEFALHSYSHDLSRIPDSTEEVKKAKAAYQKRFHRAPAGYRAPQGRIARDHFQVLSQEGFTFDSSVIPSWRPGVYCHLASPTLPYYVGNVLEVPFSVLPHFRLPLVMSYLKVLGGAYKVAVAVLGLPRIVIFAFHLHDLFPTPSCCQLPWPYRAAHGRNEAQALGIFEAFVALLAAKGYTFVTMSELAEQFPRKVVPGGA